MGLEYERSFLDAILMANAIRSKSVYLVSASVNIILTKYTDCYLSSPSNRTKVRLTAVAEPIGYK